MITFTELLERAKSEKIAIHTATEAQSITLLTELDKRGYTWNSGMKLTTETHYGNHKENICYDFEPNKKVWYCSLKFYQRGYTIIEFTDIDFAKPKITFTELQERAKTEKIAIHTPTEEQAKALLKALDEKEYEWNSDDKLTGRTYYEVRKENTCYVIQPSDNPIFNRVSFGPLQFWQEYGCTIIEFTDIDF